MLVVPPNDIPPDHLSKEIPMDENQLSTMYITKSGTINKGVKYERLSIAYLLLKLVTNDDIKNFVLSSNDPDFANFDDIVLEIERQNTKLKYAIQLKHGDTEKPLELTRTGKFSLHNFLNEFKKCKTKSAIVNFKKIIYTNKNLDKPEDTVITVKNGSENFDIQVIKSDPDAILNTSTEKNNCYKFENVSKNETVELNGVNENEVFFKNLFLYTNQINVDEVWTKIANEFEEGFCCQSDIYMKNYLHFIKRWHECQKSKSRLNKDIISQVIALCLLNPKEFQLKNEPLCKKSKIFREAISKFQISIFDEKKDCQVEKIWSDVENERSVIEAETDQDFQTIKEFVLNAPEVSNQSRIIKSLWLLNKCPLVLEDNKITRKAIDLCPDKKYILLTEPVSFKKFRNKSVFRTLSDLESHEKIYTNILSEFEFSIQHKACLPLKILTEKLNVIEKKELLQIITADELVAMLDGPLVICDDKEEIPLSYMKRRLSKNIISCKYLEREHGDFLVLISNLPEDSKLGTSLMLTEDYRNDDGPFLKRHKSSDRIIYASNSECSREDFQNLYAKHLENKEKFHHFRFISDEKLEWVRSIGEGSVGDLKEFQLDGDEIEESELHLYENDNNVNIVCGDPGMGKTELMKKLKNSGFANSWTIMIYARNHSIYFREKKSDLLKFKEYIIGRMKQRYNDFELNFVDMFMIKNNYIEMRYIWDGLDEVSDDNLTIILDLIEGLSKEGSKHWITSRNNLKQKLETKFNVLSRYIKQIDTPQQRKYIEDRLKEKNEKLVTNIINLVDDSVISFREVLGIPLLTYILTELVITKRLFINDLTERPFLISKLYRHFIDEKFNTHNKEKLSWDESNDCQTSIYEKEKVKRVKHYENLSMKIHFEEYLTEAMNANCEKFLNNIIENNNYDCMGIITRVVEGNNPVFFHSSFSEYFAASFLAREDRQGQRIDLTEEKFKNIRIFRDSILRETPLNSS